MWPLQSLMPLCGPLTMGEDVHRTDDAHRQCNIVWIAEWRRSCSIGRILYGRGRVFCHGGSGRVQCARLPKRSGQRRSRGYGLMRRRSPSIGPSHLLLDLCSVALMRTMAERGSVRTCEKGERTGSRGLRPRRLRWCRRSRG